MSARMDPGIPGPLPTNPQVSDEPTRSEPSETYGLVRNVWVREGGTRRTPPKIPRPERAPVVTSPVIEALQADVQEHGSAAMEEFWADAAARTPVVTDMPGHPTERIVTFVWRDSDAEEVLLFVNRLTDERHLADSLMRRIEGTDLWHLSYRMDADWRASYSFLPRRAGERAAWRDDHDQVAIRAALDRGQPDPRNPDRTRNRAGVEQSVVALPDAPRQSWLPRSSSVAAVEREGPDGRRVWVYRTDPAARDAALVIVLDGEVWTGPQDLAGTARALRADGLIRPAVFVFIDSGGRDARWRELADAEGVAYVVEHVLPWARAELGVSAAPRDVIVVGQSLGALTALRCGIRHPDQVGGVLSQSASLWQDDLSADLADADVAALRVYLEVGAQEWVLRAPNRALAERLARAGADVHFVEFNGGHDYACWRGGVADGLIALLGTPQPG